MRKVQAYAAIPLHKWLTLPSSDIRRLTNLHCLTISFRYVVQLSPGNCAYWSNVYSAHFFLTDPSPKHLLISSINRSLVVTEPSWLYNQTSTVASKKSMTLDSLVIACNRSYWFACSYSPTSSDFTKNRCGSWWCCQWLAATEYLMTATHFPRLAWC